MKNLLSFTAMLAAGTLLGGGLFAGILAEPAIAEPQATQDTGFSFAFRYSPAELTTKRGVNQVLSRLQNAVRRECGDFGFIFGQRANG